MPREMIYVFDVDGVVADTEDLVLDAYNAVGVDVPTETLGTHWKVWLTELCDGDLRKATELHDLKTEVYARMIDQIQPLPGCEVARDLDAWFLTSADEQITHKILDLLDVDSYKLIRGSCDVALKRRSLTLFGNDYPGGIYVDDRHDLGEEIVKDLDLWRFVHYHGQSREELHEEIVRAWTP